MVTKNKIQKRTRKFPCRDQTIRNSKLKSINKDNYVNHRAQVGKMYLIGGISLVLVIVMLLLVFKGPFAGQAIQVTGIVSCDSEKICLKESISSIFFDTLTMLDSDGSISIDVYANVPNDVSMAHLEIIHPEGLTLTAVNGAPAWDIIPAYVYNYSTRTITFDAFTTTTLLSSGVVLLVSLDFSVASVGTGSFSFTTAEVIDTTPQQNNMIASTPTPTITITADPLLDADNDSYASNVDCDDNNPGIHPLTCYEDSENDGYGNSVEYFSGCVNENYCTLNSDPDDGLFLVSNTGDCNDNDANLWQEIKGYSDSDGDGYYSSEFVLFCIGSSLPAGYISSQGADCDDTNANINPGATEDITTSEDDNCDGSLTVDTATLVAYWNFNNNVLDQTGNGHDGDFVGDPIYTNDSVIAQALEFNGSGNFLDIGDLGLTDAVTLSFWVNLDDIINDRRLFGQKDGQPSQSGALRFYSKNLEVWNGSLWITLIPTVLKTSTWMHLAIAYDGVSVVGYLNGNVQGSTISNFDFDTANLAIGSQFINKYGKFFNGKIDEVKIYDGVLSESEVTDLYNEWIDSVSSSFPTQATAGLIADYTFDGNTFDSSTHNLHGTRYGGNYVLGVSGQALHFDGVNDYIEVAHDNLLNFGSGDFSISYWARSQEDKAHHIIGKTNEVYGGDIEDRGWHITTAGVPSDVLFNVRLLTTSPDPEDYGTRPFVRTYASRGYGWSHFAAVREGEVIKVYRNGVLMATNPYAGGSIDNTVPLYIGAAIGTAYERFAYFKGDIDELKIYDVALNQSEIQNQYNTISTSASDEDGDEVVDADDQCLGSLFGVTVNATGCATIDTIKNAAILNLPFDDSENSMNDISGNGHDATVTSAVLNTTGGIGGSGAYEFDGTDDYLEVSDVFTPRYSFTLSAWIKRTNPTTVSVGIIATNPLDSANHFGIWTNLSSGGYSGEVYGTSNDIGLGSLSYPLNNWDHVVLRYNWDTPVKTVDLFVNGNLESTSYLNPNTLHSRGLMIGSDGATFFPGVIDEVLLFDTALTNEEIGVLFTDEVVDAVSVGPMLGDIDDLHDGSIDVIDLAALITCILTGTCNPAEANVDCLGGVDSVDITELINYILLGATEITCP